MAASKSEIAQPPLEALPAVLIELDSTGPQHPLDLDSAPTSLEGQAQECSAVQKDGSVPDKGIPTAESKAVVDVAVVPSSSHALEEISVTEGSQAAVDTAASTTTTSFDSTETHNQSFVTQENGAQSGGTHDADETNYDQRSKGSGETDGSGRRKYVIAAVVSALCLVVAAAAYFAIGSGGQGDAKQDGVTQTSDKAKQEKQLPERAKIQPPEGGEMVTKPTAAEPVQPKPEPKPKVTQPKPKVTEPKPLVEPKVQAVPPPPPKEVIVRSCSDAFFLSRPVCLLEGPKTFWKCSPDGKNWDNSIPGCMRQQNQ